MQPKTGRTKANRLKNFQRFMNAVDKHPETKRTEEGQKLAFKLALPGLGSASKIKEFIAHVAQGVALGMFIGREGSQLLYAAQIALSAIEREKKGKPHAGTLHKKHG
jgi:hypothetical protein